MGCRSDYMEPSGREKESKRVCEFIVYVNDKLGHVTTQWITDGANHVYGNACRLDQATNILCDLCSELSEEILYNGKDRTARRLANWWDDHQQSDKANELYEQIRQQDIDTVVKVLNNLTADELKAFVNVGIDVIKSMVK